MSVVRNSNATQDATTYDEHLISRICRVIEQSASKGVSTDKIVEFLETKTDTMTHNDIEMALTQYYNKHVCLRLVTYKQSKIFKMTFHNYN